MSTPRQDRKNYLAVEGYNGGPLSEAEVTQTLLSKAGVDDEELAELLREGVDQIKHLIKANTYVTTISSDRSTNVLEIADNNARLKAIDMLLKLTSSYPKQTAKGSRGPIYLQLPGYYEDPADRNKPS